MAAATFETDLVEIITQAAEAAAMVGSLWSSFKVVDQARDYYNLYNRQRQFYYSTFQQGAEAPLALDVYNTAIPVLSYTDADALLYANTGVFGGSMSDTGGWWTRRSASFGASPDAAILAEEFNQDDVLTHSHWENVLFRFEESNTDILSDQRWDHRMKLHNVALKQQSAVLSGLASAEGQREDAMSATSSRLADMGNSLAERRGMIQGHKDVQARYAQLSGSANTQYAILDRGRAFSPASTFPLGSSASATPGVFEDVR
jgi:hypothetical protein